MLPIPLIRMSSGQEVEVWLKSGSFVRGTLYTVDHLMNLNMKNVVITNKTGDKQTSKDIFIKGIEVLTMSLPELAMTKAMDYEAKHAEDFEKYKSVKASRVTTNNGPRKTFNGPRRNCPPNGQQPVRRNFGGRQNGTSGGNKREDEVVVTTTDKADDDDWGF